MDTVVMILEKTYVRNVVTIAILNFRNNLRLKMWDYFYLHLFTNLKGSID